MGASPTLRVALPLALLLAAACTAGPNYHRPVAAMPAMFKEQPPPGSTLAAEWQKAAPSDEQIRAQWWEAFGDAQLTALESQVAGENQGVAAAEARFRGARAAIRGVRADLFPTVTVGASVSAARVSPNRSAVQRGVATGTAVDFELPIDFSYEIDAWGRVRRSIEASVATAQASAADVQTTLLSSTSELAVDYFSLCGVDAQAQLLNTTVDAYRRALQVTQARYQQGVAAGTDVAQAKTQLDTTLAQATDLGVARAQFEHAIAILIGKAPADLTIPPDVQPVAPPSIPIALPSVLVERRPDVAGAERRVAAANAQIGIAEAAYFPSLTLSASGGLQSTILSTLLTWPSRFWSIGPQLAQTVFDGGRRRSATDQAIANYEETVAVYRQDVLTAFQDVEDNLAALRVLADEDVQAQQAVASADRSLTLANVRYTGGITTYLEVITAQTAALANERTLVDLRTRRLTSSVLLIKALGGGWSTANLPSAGAVTP
jgi:NodT family efflux transporter outer membrane factor (OMF) lipoprotein